MDGHIAAKQDKSEDIAIFGLCGEQELVRLLAVCDGAPKPGNPMEHDGRLVLVGEQLADDVGNEVDSAEYEEGGDEDEKRGHGEESELFGSSECVLGTIGRDGRNVVFNYKHHGTISP